MKLALWLAVALVAILVLACGGDDDGGDNVTDITPVGTKDSTPTPVASDTGGGGPPAPAEPSLDEELTEITRGDLEAMIDPGGAYAIDPEAMAVEAGAGDVCSNFQFDFSWQILDPYPPDGTALSWQYEGQSGQVEVASGPSGNQAVGCGGLSAVNNGAGAITVAVMYAMGSLQ